MPIFDPGTVVVVDYQYTSGTHGGPRPSVVVSSRAHQTSKADVVIIPFTTRMHSTYVGDYDLLDWQSAGLPRASRAKGGAIATIEQRTVRRVLGTLTQRDMDGVKASLRIVLEL